MPNHRFPVEFSVTAEGYDDLVVYEGKVFEAGDYPDKAFAIDEGELAEKALAFRGVDLDLEHSPFKDLLGHKLGRLEAVWNRGAEAIGRLRIPRWLHELAGGKLQTSLSFNQDKNIVGCALTLNPRIADAQVLAAFAAGDRATERPNDRTGEGRRGEGPTSDHVGGPGRSFSARLTGCHLPELSPTEPFIPAAPALEMSRGDHGERVRATSGPSYVSTDPKETSMMPNSLKERLRVLFGKAPDALQEAGIDPRELDTIEFTQPTPEPDPAIQAQLAEFKATNDRLIAGQLNVAAALFADDVVRAAKAVPAQRDQLIAVYKSAAIADGKGVIRFTDAGNIEDGPNLLALRELFKNAQPHSLFTTQIPNADPNEGDETKPDPKMVERLRSATSLGQATRADQAFAKATAGKETN